MWQGWRVEGREDPKGSLVRYFRRIYWGRITER